MTTTEIAPSDLTRASISLREGKATLRQAVGSLIGPAPVEHPAEDVTFPAVPKAKEITAEDREALLALPLVFGSVVMENRRTLEPAEIAAVHKEREVLKRISALMEGRADNLGEYIRTHVDVDAVKRHQAVLVDVTDEEGNVVKSATPRDKDGHLVLSAPQKPVRVPIEGTNQEFSLEYWAPRGQVTLDASELLRLYEDKEISREDYLSLTREVRVFDESKAQAACAKNPALLAVIAKIAKYPAAKPGTSLFVRKAK